MKNIWEKKIILLVFLVTLSAFLVSQKNEMNFKMRIKAAAIPVFAIDKKGNPVLDLKKNEIEVFLNSKKIEYYLKQQNFKTNSEKETTDTIAKVIPRLIYLCFDNIFNTREGLERSKTIARELINNSNSVDQFVLLNFSITKGIDLIGGPMKKSSKLISIINKINSKNALNPNHLFKVKAKFSENPGFYDIRDIRNGNMTTMHKREIGASSRPSQFIESAVKIRNTTVNSYNSLIKIFANIFEKLEGLLEIVNRPKLVFLFSHGMNLEGESIVKNVSKNSNKQKEKTKEKKTQVNKKVTRIYSQLFLKYMKRIAQTVNNSGSLLFTINSTNSRGGSAALKCMADQSGGKYYQKQNTDNLVKEIKRDIAAYYEIYFQLDETIKNPIQIKFKCTRKGVRIKSIRSLNQINNFAQLSDVKKKAFIINSTMNNNWKKYFNNTKVVPYKIIKKKKGIYEYQVNILKSGLTGGKIEIYLVSKTKGLNEFGLDLIKKKAKNIETIKIKREQNKNYIFVIVDLKKSSCYYNIARI